MTTPTAQNGLLIRIFDSELEAYKKEIPNLIPAFGLTDEDVLKIMAAEKMRVQFASAPVSWHVQPREMCDDAVLGWRLGILNEHQLPLKEKTNATQDHD